MQPFHSCSKANITKFNCLSNLTNFLTLVIYRICLLIIYISKSYVQYIWPNLSIFYPFIKYIISLLFLPSSEVWLSSCWYCWTWDRGGVGAWSCSKNCASALSAERDSEDYRSPAFDFGEFSFAYLQKIEIANNECRRHKLSDYNFVPHCLSLFHLTRII